jgi:hypothetical protein
LKSVYSGLIPLCPAEHPRIQGEIRECFLAKRSFARPWHINCTYPCDLKNFRAFSSRKKKSLPAIGGQHPGRMRFRDTRHELHGAFDRLVLATPETPYTYLQGDAR